MLNGWIFQLHESEMGSFTADRFASADNKKLKRFNSLFWNPGTERVNAFSVSWGKENNWLVPPIFLISSTILHVIRCKAKGTLIVPQWPSAPFWPLLFSHKFESHSYVADFITFKSPSGIFKIGKYKGSLIGSKKFSSPVLAIKMDASYSCYRWEF